MSDSKQVHTTQNEDELLGKRHFENTPESFLKFDKSAIEDFEVMDCNKKVRVVQHQKGLFNLFHYFPIDNKYLKGVIDKSQELLITYYGTVGDKIPSKLEKEESCHISLFEQCYIPFGLIGPVENELKMIKLE